MQSGLIRTEACADKRCGPLADHGAGQGKAQREISVRRAGNGEALGIRPAKVKPFERLYGGIERRLWRQFTFVELYSFSHINFDFGLPTYVSKLCLPKAYSNGLVSVLLCTLESKKKPGRLHHWTQRRR